MEKTDTKTVVTGIVLTFSENHGWALQEPPNPRENDTGVRSMAEVLQRFIGKKVVMTVEETPK